MHPAGEAIFCLLFVGLDKKQVACRGESRRFRFLLIDQRKKKGTTMDNLGWIAVVSIFSAGLCIGLGAIGPALGEGRALAQALSALAQQPDEANTITRTLFVGMAMVESTAIYCFVVTMILLFANPFWNYFLQQTTGG
jgi:F-type H+-transporting ATPase subunit c